MSQKKKRKKKPSQNIFKEILTFSSIREPPPQLLGESLTPLPSPSGVLPADKGASSQGKQPLPHHHLRESRPESPEPPGAGSPESSDVTGTIPDTHTSKRSQSPAKLPL